jgi:uncharacterized NAD(P)/FAD-binding protein YdhS
MWHKAAMIEFDLAVVGGGPAGLCTTLAARALAPAWRIAWCRGPEPAFLPAYAGNSLVHRLNVPVERMGLVAEAPVDFYDWLQHEHPARAVAPGQFVPRRWFGDYMAARAAGCGAEERGGAVAAVERAGEGWRLAFVPASAEGAAAEAPLQARRVALCLGMPAGLPMPNAPAHWVADPWAWWRALPASGVPLAPGDTVLVVGSGLTAVDMVLGLRERGFAGRLRVVSPAGAWSQPHAAAAPLDAETREQLDEALDAADGARALVHALRAFGAAHPWRAVVDALRADTNARWAALAPDEQRRLLRHGFGAWNRHRHRMAPDVAATLEADAALSIERGRVHVDAAGTLWKRHRGLDERLEVALALDCRGPGFRAALAGDSLLARLVRGGVLEAHPLGTGVRPPAEPTLAVLGAARFGERFETSAVPELRQQALEAVRRWVAAPR